MKPDNVNHPSHYADHCSIECFDALKAVLGYEGAAYFCFGNMFKYLWRHKFKNGKEDIEKAIWYSMRATECIISIKDTDEHKADHLSGIGCTLLDILKKADKEYDSPDDKRVFKNLLNSIYSAKNMSTVRDLDLSGYLVPGNVNEPEEDHNDELKRKLDQINANSYYGLFPKENPATTFNILSEESLKKWEELMNDTFEVKEKEDKDLDDGLDEMLEKLAEDYNVDLVCVKKGDIGKALNYVYGKEEKNDAKDESPSEAEKTLGVISNIITDDRNTTDPAHKIAKIRGVLAEYYRKRCRSDS